MIKLIPEKLMFEVDSVNRKIPIVIVFYKKHPLIYFAVTSSTGLLKIVLININELNYT